MKIQAEGRASTKALNGMSRASLRNRKKGQELGNRDNDKVCDWKQGYAGWRGQLKGAGGRSLDFIPGAVDGKPPKGFKQRRDRYTVKSSFWLPRR